MKISIKKTKLPARKTTIAILLGTMFLFLFSGCNFDFPKENEEIWFATDLEYHFNTGSEGGEITLAFPDLGTIRYRIMVYPQWVETRQLEGILNNGYSSIPFSFKNVDSFMTGNRVEGFIFLRLGENILRLTISYGADKTIEPPVEGQVPLHCSTAEINFGTEDSRSFTMVNPGTVDKSWYVNNIPSWLELSQTSGFLEAGASLAINCSVRRQDLLPGEYSAIINIESSHPQASHGILVNMVVEDPGPPVNSARLKWINGTVTDARFCKKTGNLYVLTKTPNALLVKTPESDTLTTYPLERIPNCIDVTADGKTLAVGYNQAFVDLLDVATFSRTKQYVIDCVPHDLVFGENNWLYMIPDADQWVYFYSLNLNSGVTFRTETRNFYEKSVLVKVPGKPWIYITRPQLSPSGLQIVNIENGAANDTVPGWHEDTGAMIWLSPEGDKIFGANKTIYRAPEYTKETYHLDLPKTGEVDIPRNFIKSLDYNEVMGCYFMAGSDYWWGTENASTIYQVNKTSFSAEKSVNAGYYPGYLKNQYNPAMDVYYIFSNATGTKLFALKNVKQSLEMNIWALEIFDLPLN